MNDISDIRTKIDDIDKQLVPLLNQRAELAREIGRVKGKRGAAVYDPMRELDVLNRIDALNEGPLGKGAIEEVYAAIITACREIQLD